MTFVKRDGTVFLTIGTVVWLAGALFPLATTEQSVNSTETGTVSGRVLLGGAEAPEGVSAANVIVYLVGDSLLNARPTQPLPAPTMDQFDYTFVPHVLPVLAGTRITFTNNDPETHNIHTYTKSRRRKNRTFNQAQKPGSVMSAVFPRPDSIRVQCDIHAQMLAHIFVLPNPFFTMAADDGTFSIAGVPTGNHELIVWHEEYGTMKALVDVQTGATTTVELDFSSRPRP